MAMKIVRRALEVVRRKKPVEGRLTETQPLHISDGLGFMNLEPGAQAERLSIELARARSRR